MWVRSKYAGELAVLSTWLCGLMPWSVTVLSSQGFTAIFLWLLPGNFLFTPGVSLPDQFERPFWVWNLRDFPLYIGETFVTYFWLAGAAVFALALAFSVLYYVADERVESFRLDPVRTLGGSLLVSGLCFVVAFALLWRNHEGITIPVGVLFLLVFGAVLLRTERVPVEETGSVTDPE